MKKLQIQCLCSGPILYVKNNKDSLYHPKNNLSLVAVWGREKKWNSIVERAKLNFPYWAKGPRLKKLWKQHFGEPNWTFLIGPNVQRHAKCALQIRPKVWGCAKMAIPNWANGLRQTKHWKQHFGEPNWTFLIGPNVQRWCQAYFLHMASHK